MKGDVSSDSLPSFDFSSIAFLSSCVKVSVGPEEEIEIENIYVFLVSETWFSTSHFVTIFLLSNSVVKTILTHSSSFSNLMSTSFEEVSFVSYVVVVYGFYQRRWITPSTYFVETS